MQKTSSTTTGVRRVRRSRAPANAVDARATAPQEKPSAAATAMAEWERRSHIIEEYHLRREVARLEALRRSDPQGWRNEERRRAARNRDQQDLNRRLRAAGCSEIPSELSLPQKVQKLQRLEALNRAELARFRGSQ